jgi:hypothetical protein
VLTVIEFTQGNSGIMVLLTEQKTWKPTYGPFKTKLADSEILDTILAPENFRVLEQNMRGTIREWYFEKYARENGLELINISELETSSKN